MISLGIVGLLAGMVLVTYATRYTMIGLLAGSSLPLWARRWLQLVPAAVFTAIVVPAILAPQGYIDLSLSNHYAWAGLICALVAWRTKHTVATILIGMAAFWLLLWAGG